MRALIDHGLVELDGMKLCKEFIQLEANPTIRPYTTCQVPRTTLGQDPIIEPRSLCIDVSRLGAINLDCEPWSSN